MYANWTGRLWPWRALLSCATDCNPARRYFCGVVTRSPERRQQLSTDLPGVKAFDSIGQIVEAGVDALVISTTLKGRPALVRGGHRARRRRGQR